MNSDTLLKIMFAIYLERIAKDIANLVRETGANNLPDEFVGALQTLNYRIAEDARRIQRGIPES